MKKLALLATILGMAGSAALAQGTFNFDNTAAYSGAANGFTTTIGSTGAAGEGAHGAVTGSDGTHATPNYDISFLYQLGTANVGNAAFAADPTLFAAAGGSNGVAGSFSAATGDAVDGGGLYGLGTAVIPGTTDGSLITVQAIAWYDPNGSTSYQAAHDAGYNVGGGALVQIRLANGTDLNVADMSLVNGFTVQPVPEPSIIALSSIGAAALMLVRRKK